LTDNPIPFLNLKRHHAPIEAEVLDRWTQILESGAFVSGSYVAAFERGFAELHDTDHAIAVANGTVALELIWRGLGVGPGDRVIVPASTFIATAEAVSNVGARPLFVDCEPGTGNIDVEQTIAAMDDPDVVGLVPVHLYGQPADMDPLLSAGRDRGLHIVEDAAQAHAARYKNRSIGGLGDASGFSFYPGKNLGAPGEGGAVLTNDAELASRIRLLANHGEGHKYRSDIVGTNARMMELVAAMLDVKLPRLEAASEGRRRVAARYRDLLGDTKGLTLPVEHEWATPVYHLFVVEVDNRQSVMDHLEERGVASGLHYPVPLHLQPAYSDLGYHKGAFPVAEARADRIVSLPIFPEMTEPEIEAVAAALKEAVSA
jgi:dTDP-4-amino-4,6-dideoxygalactose transaminase